MRAKTIPLIFRTKNYCYLKMKPTKLVLARTYTFDISFILQSSFNTYADELLHRA